MMKHFFLSILFFFSFSCTFSPKDFRIPEIEKWLSSHEKRYDYCIVIPGAGCDGCISGAEYFVVENYQRANVLYIFTKIESVKLLKHKLGDNIVNAPNILLDVDGMFDKNGNNPNDIYPAIYNISQNKVTDVNYMSPQNGMAMEDLKKQFEKEAVFKIDLESYIKHGDCGRQIKLSDITDSVTYIPLKTNYNLPIAEIQEVRTTDDFIFCLDTQQKLFCFNRNGDFITLIGKRGEGPEEYINIADFDVDGRKGEVYLFDLQRHFIMVYNVDGRFSRRIKLPDNILNIAKYYDSQFIAYAPEYLGNERDKLIIFNDKGEKRDSILFQQEENIGNTKIDIFKMATFAFQSHFLCRLPFSDITYALTPIGNQYKYVEFQQGKYKLPYKIGSNVESYNENLNSSYIFEPRFYKCQNLIFINFFFKMNNYQLLYNSDKNVFFTVFKGKYPVGIENDIDNGPPFWPVYIKGDRAVGIATAFNSEYDNPVLQVINIALENKK